MIAKFDYYNRFEQPVISLRNPNDEFIGFIDNIKNLNINPEFNAVSEMTCDIYKYGNDNNLLDIYDDIKVKRQLFVENIGFFIITQVTENDSKDGVYKSLTLYSCEHELSYKKLTYFNGTYKFWGTENLSDSLLGKILNSLPRWSVGHIDDSVANLYRTFEEPDTTIYSFLMDEVENSYECIFEFDIINRMINVYDKNNYIHKTTILLSRKDVIDNFKIDTKSEDIYTALTLYGDDEISYRGINPLGTSTVYNFLYYKNWMSEDLQAALTIWEQKVSDAETNTTLLRTNLSNKSTELQKISGEIDSIKEQIILLEKQLGVNSLDKTMINSLKSQINTKKVELAKQQSSYDSIAVQINKINKDIEAIHTSCSFKNNFTEEQLQELDAYIFEGSEVEDTLAFTDDMSFNEQEDILKQLYNKAKNMLADISIPTEELSLDTNNFIFQKEFLPYAEQLSTGVIIDIEVTDGIIISYVLLKMEVNYQDKSISLTFGNKYRSNNAKSLWSDWESNVSKSSNTLTYERSKYGKAVDSGSLDKMNTFMNSSLDLTLNQVKSSDGQSFEMTDSGWRGRRINPETGQVDSEQLWMTSNNIVFTDDDWETIKTAIGRIILPDGTIGYGINAEFLLGKMIIAEGMEISNKSGTFIINENGVTIQQYDEKIKDLEDSQSMTLVTLTSSGQFFNYTENGYEPDSIILTPSYRNCVYSQWQYSLDGLVWTDIDTSLEGVEITTTNSLVVFRNCPLFDSETSTIIFKVIAQNEKTEEVVYDLVSLAKMNKSVSVLSIIPEYYLSSSSVELLEGEWVESQPEYENNKYLWVRSKIIYVDNTITYTAEYCDNTWTIINDKTSAIEDDLKNLEDNTNSELNELKNYIRIENGRIFLGKIGNQIELKIDNDKISFLQNGQEVAYFSNKKLYVTDAEYTNSLQIGNFAFTPRQNGNLSFSLIVKGGGNE